MKVSVQKTFEKDIAKIHDKKLAAQVLHVIEDLENASQLSELHHLKKIKGHRNYHRIRIGDYRLGFKTEDGTVIVLRFMHRKDIYTYFP